MDQTSGIILGPYRLDRLSHSLTTPKGEVRLSPLASDFLVLLAEQPGEVVARDRLIELLWRGDFLLGDRALNRLVSEVRSAIGDDPRRPRLIQTVPRRGYRLAVEPAAAAPAARPALPLWIRLLIACAAVTLGLCALLLSIMAVRHFR
jgi:DNA-binding winged helix-turn-helix (wHTH) protein